MYGKLFAQMYDGTLGTRGPWQALVTFQQLIILADQDGVVDMTAEAISRRTTIPLEIVRLGIAALEEPDPDSRTPDEEGRRILRLSDDRGWGWSVVNYDKYRKIRTAEDRREYMRLYQQARRASEKGEAVNSSTTRKQNKPIVEVDAEADAKAIPLWDAVWSAYPKRAGGNSKAAALKAYTARVRSGVEPSDILAGVQRYARFLAATGKVGTEYVKQAATFFGPDAHWAEPWDIPATAGDRRATAVTSMLEGWANGE
tara:strand:+ start:2501 stop:3271 length:771 start_codon:yes stop_codon:yes gene_type:complete